MLRRLRTVKWQVFIFMIGFAVLVTALVLAFSIYMSRTYQERTTRQSVEFSLKLTADLLSQELRELAQLAGFSARNEYVSSFFTETRERRIRPLTFSTWSRLHEELHGSRVSGHVRRLIVFSNDHTRLIQLGNFAPGSLPLNQYSLPLILDIKPETSFEWRHVDHDPYYRFRDEEFIALSCPVYSMRDRSVIGSVVLLVPYSIIEDKLMQEGLPEGSDIFVGFGGELPEGLPDDPSQFVMYHAHGGIVLAQTLPQTSFIYGDSHWIEFLSGIIAAIIGMALLIIVGLDRAISRPVARIRKKLDSIACGDFTPDKSLETGGEVGIIGYGINQLALNISSLMESALAKEKAKRDLEYRMLQAQINPHFLYNTLNSIKWMATLQNATGIAEMTTSLSRLLKTISKDMRKEVELREELELLDDYIIIQGYRYGGRITVTRDIEDKSLENAMLPRFSLQPLVENAIFHGIEPKGGGSIVISAKRVGDFVEVAVTDDGVGMTPTEIEAALSGEAEDPVVFEGVGIRSVNERLRIMYGDECGLSIESVKGVYTTMRITLKQGIQNP